MVENQPLQPKQGPDGPGAPSGIDYEALRDAALAEQTPGTPETEAGSGVMDTYRNAIGQVDEQIKDLGSQCP